MYDPWGRHRPAGLRWALADPSWNVRVMTRFFQHRTTRRWLGTLLAVAVLARAWVPAGFMPTAGHPLELRFCHAGMVMPDAAKGGQAPLTPSTHVEHCPFGSAPVTAAVVALPVVGMAPALVLAHRIVEFSTLRATVALAAAHRARGPPAAT